MPTVVALTGATGFIGQHVTRRLLAVGFQVKALKRSQAKAKALEGLLQKEGLTKGLTWISGDLSDPCALDLLFEGADYIVHLAGAIRGGFETLGEVNIKGFWHLLAAWRSEVPFLYVSSLAARHPYLSPYAATKRAAEDFLKDLNAPWTIFRPPAVYGPGDRELLPLIRLMEKGIVPVFGAPHHRFSLIHVSDLAEAIVCWLANPQEKKLYELHDGKPGGYSWEEIAEIVSRLRKKPVITLRLPKRPFLSLAWANLHLARLFKYQAMLTPGKIHELFHHHWVCDNTPIEKDLGWKPRLDLEKGLRDLMRKV